MITSLKKTFIHISSIRYLIVGLLNTIIMLTIIYTVKWTVNLADVYANMLGCSVGLVFSFIVNKNWTFNYKGGMQLIYIKFLSIFAIAYFVNLMVVLFSISYLNINSYISHALGIPAYTIIGYLGNRFFVFNKS